MHPHQPQDLLEFASQAGSSEVAPSAETNMLSASAYTN